MKIFLLQPYSSHLYPAFGLASEYLVKGEQIVFATTLEFAGLVKSEGFEHIEFRYLSEYIIKNSKSFFGLLLRNLISKNDIKILQAEFEQNFKQVKKIINKYNPSHVYIDQSLAEYYFFFKPFLKNITILHTKLYSGRTKGIPPLNSTLIPNESLLSKIKVEILWLKELSKLRVQEFILKIVFLGKDEIYLWKLHCVKFGISWRKEIDLKHLFNRGVKSAENLVLSPKALEFKSFKLFSKLGFYEKIYQKNEELYKTVEYENFKRKYFMSNYVVIYIAFGTFANGFKMENFFKQVISLTMPFNNIILIISKGKSDIDIETTKNVYVQSYLPQQDVLSRADLFITHGGLGSIKEAFVYNVPMLVVPINKYVDQNGNAARIESNKLGYFLNIDNYTTEELGRKINLLIPKGKSIAQA